jgi:RecJ-like exonuclease
VSWLVHDAGACASQLTYARFRESLDPDMSRVALYGAIGDYKDESPLARELMKTWDSRSLYYEAGTISQGIAIGRKDYDHKRDIVLSLSKNVLPSQMPVLAKNAVIASLKEDELRLRTKRNVVRLNNLSYVIDQDGFLSKAAIYSHIYGGTCVGVAAEFLKSKNVYDVSIRAKGDCNLNELVGEAAHMNGGTGGGHPQAAGGRIPAPNIMDFIKDLDSLIASGRKRGVS